VAGLSLSRSIDTGELEAPEAEEAERLVDRLDLDDLARRSPLRGGGADRFQYDLSVERDRRRHRLTVAEDAAPPALRQLLAWVLEHADER
jgi:hypothetical protein